MKMLKKLGSFIVKKIEEQGEFINKSGFYEQNENPNIL